MLTEIAKTPQMLFLSETFKDYAIFGFKWNTKISI